MHAEYELTNNSQGPQKTRWASCRLIPEGLFLVGETLRVGQRVVVRIVEGDVRFCAPAQAVGNFQTGTRLIFTALTAGDRVELDYLRGVQE